MVAVRELQEEYKGKITSKIDSATTDAGRQAAADHDFGRSGHGLVGFNANGEQAFVMMGHSYSKEEIKKNIEEMLR